MLKLVRCVLRHQDWQMMESSVACVAAGLTTWQMWEDSPETFRKGAYRGREYEVHLPSTVLEIVTDDSWLQDVIAKLTELQKLADGRRIEVFSVEESYRIRDGFMDR